jgi:hypothetical protein
MNILYMSSLKEMMNDKYKFEIPMSLYDINNTSNKNIILENMVEIIKQNGNIFLLGYPTNTITMLMLKVYHENIVRIMNSENPIDILMFMTGMLELYGEEGTIYVTISESEREGLDYNKKLEAFYSILVNSGCNVTFIDGNSELILDTSYKTGETDFTNVMYDKIKDVIFLDKVDKDKDGLNYSSIIKNYPITVKLINSTNYIKKREEGFSFLPFKTIKPGNKIHCIYGSLCVEAKLFGYMYSLGKKWDDVKGYIAYWVGKSIPPNHILKKYNYIKGTIDDAKIKQMTDITIELLDKDTIEKLNESCKNSLQQNEAITFSENSVCMNIFINAVQPIALTCPGCYLNWQSYINNIQVKWDNSVCGHVTVSGGYKIKRKTKKTKKTKQKNKTKKQNKTKKTKLKTKLKKLKKQNK